MNEINVFENKEFGEIRTIRDGEKVLFCGSDVAKALGYGSNPQDAIRRHCREDGCVNHAVTDKLGRVQEAKFIDEGNLYRLIAHSKLPSAQRFEQWVFDEVLPSIRKTGGYIAGQETLSDDELLAKALIVAQRRIEEREMIIKQQRNMIEEQKPLVDFATHVSQSKNTVDMDEMAKIARNENINIGRNRLIRWMKDKKILKDNRTPYQSFIERGYFDVIETKKDTVYGTMVFPKTVVTGKGQLWLIERLRDEYDVNK